MIPQTAGPAIPAPFCGPALRVRPEWIDDNGHLNLAYYLVLFDWGTDALWAEIGIGDPLRASGHATFAAESHILYRAELVAEQSVTVRSQLLGVDEKRLHVAHELLREGAVAAQQELMFLCVDLGTRKVARWPERFAAGLRAAVASHAALPRPDWVGRRVRTLEHFPSLLARE